VDSCPSNLPTDGQTFRRIEVLTGTPRRRRWSAEEKASIVAESLAPGAVARTVALRHGLHANQLYLWRRDFASAEARGFVPVALTTDGDEAKRREAGTIEIEIAGAILRVTAGVDASFLGAVLRAVKMA
jgi:transposase